MAKEGKEENIFELFGEFDTAEELNEAAVGLKKEGDNENLLKLANENGIDKEVAEAFINGDIDVLTDYFMAAAGKLEVEKQKLDSRMPVDPIVDYLISQCMEEEFAKVVRSKNKNLKDCIKHTEKKCEEECKRTGHQYIADMTVFEWSKEYYEKGGNDE